MKMDKYRNKERVKVKNNEILSETEINDTMFLGMWIIMCIALLIAAVNLLSNLFVKDNSFYEIRVGETTYVCDDYLLDKGKSTAAGQDYTANGKLRDIEGDLVCYTDTEKIIVDVPENITVHIERIEDKERITINDIVYKLKNKFK